MARGEIPALGVALCCPRCFCRLMAQPDGRPTCANCGHGELWTRPAPPYDRYFDADGYVRDEVQEFVALVSTERALAHDRHLFGFSVTAPDGKRVDPRSVRLAD